MAVNSIRQAILDDHEAGRHTSEVLWRYKVLLCPACQHETGMSPAYMMMRVHGASLVK
jgi:hypothetical protein